MSVKSICATCSSDYDVTKRDRVLWVTGALTENTICFVKWLIQNGAMLQQLQNVKSTIVVVMTPIVINISCRHFAVSPK